MICRLFGHRYRPMTGARGLVSWDRCRGCGILRMTKGREPRGWRRIRDHRLARRLLAVDLAAIAAVLALAELAR